MRKYLIFGLAALLSLAACTQEREIDIPGADMSLIARTESPAGTKTIVQGETHVYWEPGDEIAVFSGEKSGKFLSTLTAASATSTFKGTLGTDAWTEGMDLWAVYPYSEDAVFEGETITAVLPSEQAARAGSFGKGMNLAVAHSTTSELQFYNVGGGLRFSLKEDGIKEVVLEGMDGETLAGKVTVGFQDGKPAILDVAEGKTSITLVPSEGESFQKDTWYYFVAIPGALEKGFKLHFHKTDILGSRVFDKAVTIKRSLYGTLTHADEGAAYSEVSDENIVFKDELVKSIVVKYFDTSGDGELSYREAAVVLSFLVDEAETRSTDGKVSIFAGTDITSFDELVYFTGLTRIEDGAFAGCTGLTSITIPENIVEIGANAFNGCTSLESITMMSETPPAIGTDAFANTNDCPILVPEDAIEEYLSAWNEYAPRIQANPYPVPEMVDLGLSVKWASFNLGASKPEESGDYYAWGELEPYYEPGYAQSSSPKWRPGKEPGYCWESYRLCEGLAKTLTKYNTYPQYGSDGFIDYKTVLEPEDDAAHVKLGDKWRMPTKEELTELIEKCTWTWTTGEVNGYVISSPTNGNSIFIPTAGYWAYVYYNKNGNWNYPYGSIWSSSVNTKNPIYAYNLAFGSDYEVVENEWWSFRYYGHNIRPVFGDAPATVSVELVSLDQSQMEIVVGKSSTLIATVLPEQATEPGVVWSSSDESVATVTVDGVVLGISVGSAVITATTIDGCKTATCRVTVKPYSSSLLVPEMVDLGLPSGLKWASFNLGATKPEESGDYFAWGETIPKIEYQWSTYKWSEGYGTSFTKYCDNPSLGYNGFTDNKTTLDPEDDAAHVHLGDKWRMPTGSELSELCEQCTWEWITLNEMDGYQVTGPSGKSIFIPAAGYKYGTVRNSYNYLGDCASSSLASDRSRVQILSIWSSTHTLATRERYAGETIRPVFGDPPIPVEGITLDKDEITLQVGETSTLVTIFIPENATNQAVIWSSSNESVATVSQDGVITGVGVGMWGTGTATITATTVDGGKQATCTVTVNDSQQLSFKYVIGEPTTCINEKYEVVPGVMNYPFNISDQNDREAAHLELVLVEGETTVIEGVYVSTAYACQAGQLAFGWDLTPQGWDVSGGSYYINDDGVKVYIVEGEVVVVTKVTTGMFRFKGTGFDFVAAGPDYVPD